MSIVAKLGEALQWMFGQVAETAAWESQVIQRTRKFTALSLARTFILDFPQNPKASVGMLAKMASQCGAAVTPHAVEQRRTPRLVDFFGTIVSQRHAVGHRLRQCLGADFGTLPFR